MIREKKSQLSEEEKNLLFAKKLHTQIIPRKEDKEKFQKKQKEIIGRLKKSEIVGNSKAEQVAKKQTLVHWIVADIKRAKVNMKHAIKNKDLESFNYHRAKLKNALEEIQNEKGIG